MRKDAGKFTKRKLKNRVRRKISKASKKRNRKWQNKTTTSHSADTIHRQKIMLRFLEHGVQPGKKMLERYGEKWGFQYEEKDADECVHMWRLEEIKWAYLKNLKKN